MGIFPTSGIRAFTNLLSIKTKFGESHQESLMQLEGINLFKAVRLEEECVYDVVGLANGSPAILHLQMGISLEQLSDWTNCAQLASVVGPVKYNSLKDICRTNSFFQKEMNDDGRRPDFIQKLASINVINPDEILNRLEDIWGKPEDDESDSEGSASGAGQEGVDDVGQGPDPNS